MKILLDGHLLDKKAGGMRRYWVNLTSNLTRFNEIEKIFLYSQNLSWMKKNSKIVLTRPNSVNPTFRILYGFNKSILSFKPDIIHVNFFGPVLKKCPLITTIHDLCFITNPELFNPFFTSLATMWVKKTLFDSNAIICVSNVIKGRLLKTFRLKNKIITTIYSAPDPRFYRLKDKQRIFSILRERFNIEQTYFLVPGDVDCRGLSSMIIDSFLKIFAKYKKAQLVFTGKNKNNDYKYIINNKRIRVLNYVNDEDLNYLYNCARAVIYLSKCEGFGFPILEAMRCGVPIICNDLDVFREIASNSAMYVKNASMLYSTADKLLFDRKLAYKYINSGLKRVKQFSWEKTAKQTLDVYKSVLNVV